VSICIRIYFLFSTGCSKRSKPQRVTAWVLGCRSAVPLSRDAGRLWFEPNDGSGVIFYCLRSGEPLRHGAERALRNPFLHPDCIQIVDATDSRSECGDRYSTTKRPHSCRTGGTTTLRAGGQFALSRLFMSNRAMRNSPELFQSFIGRKLDPPRILSDNLSIC
jgi:hypothetical protein